MNVSHESQNRENNKSGNKTGATVQQADPEDIPVDETGVDRHCAFIRRSGSGESSAIIRYCGLLITVVAVFVVAAHND